MVEGKVLRRAVFLDRDGTLNKDVGYVHRKEDWQWLPGVAEALKRLRAVGYVLVVVSNQSGIARGMYDREALRRAAHKLRGEAVTLDFGLLARQLQALENEAHTQDRQQLATLNRRLQMESQRLMAWLNARGVNEP